MPTSVLTGDTVFVLEVDNNPSPVLHPVEVNPSQYIRAAAQLVEVSGAGAQTVFASAYVYSITKADGVQEVFGGQDQFTWSGAGVKEVVLALRANGHAKALGVVSYWGSI